MKKLMSFVIATAMLLTSNVVGMAEKITADDNVKLMAEAAGFITEDWSKIEYISVEEYIEKYGGEEKINKAFNEAEIKNEAMLLKAGGKEQQAVQLLNEKNNLVNKKSDLLLSIKEGKFLGLEIESISDLPPDNLNLSLRLKQKNDLRPMIGVSENAVSAGLNENMSATTAQGEEDGTHRDGTAYKILYTNTPGDADSVYEPESGSYFYKYGYSWKNDYRCTSDITFNNTQLYNGSQVMNMYAFIGAVTDDSAVGGTHSIDFGFMANPSAQERNKGLYAVRNIKGQPAKFDVEIYPKVLLDSASSTNHLIVENRKIKLQLTIDTLGNVETVMYENGSMIYYKTESITGFVSGAGHSLTFFEAMSCVDANSVETKPNSGSYFKNVRFSDTKLYSYDSGERAFGTYGDDTYYVYLCKPEKIDYSFGDNYEEVSIIYN